MRQRQVKWAAMEFLQKSYKKHRRWIWLKQLLLLLMRMLAVAAVVAMLAGLVTKDQASFLGGQATHHFVLLDDSLSMGDQTSNGRAFDDAMQALRRIAEQLAAQPTDQRVTLLRFSEATKASSQNQIAADLNAVVVDSDFVETMEKAKRTFEVADLALGATGALQVAERLISNAAEKNRVAYVISDFRQDDWDQSSGLKESLRNLRKNDCDLHLIRCIDAQHQNLAIVEVQPEAGTLAAGVPLLMNVKVRNFGPAAAQQVQIRLSAKSFPDNVFITPDNPVEDQQVTTLVIDEIPKGEVATRQTQMKFDRAGQHIVEARLTGDALSADNVRQCLLEIPAAIPVLIVDGGAQPNESYYLQSIFSPGERIVTGIQSVARTEAYLRDAADTELGRYAVIYLMNVERLDPKAISALKRYVSGGGGLAFFAGPNCDPAFLNETYEKGEGLFPLPVQSDRQHVRVVNDDSPDIQVHDHPIFRVLVDEGGKNRPLTKRIRIDRFFPADPDWKPSDAPNTEILATLRGGDPLVVSRRFGEGQVVAFLTTASPEWNNWAMGPSYPVVILQLHGFLSSTSQAARHGLAGEPITFQLETSEFSPAVEIVRPTSTGLGTGLAASGSATSSIKREPTTQSVDSALMTFSIGGDGDERTGETDVSGTYVANLLTLEGQPRQSRFVLNVPTTESDLAVLDSPTLAEQLDDLQVEIHDVDELEYESTDQDGFSWSQLLAGLLIVLLLGEQAFAYSASYHPKGGGK